VAIISTIFEESVIALVVLFGLPQIGVNIPLAGLVALMAIWLILSVVIYQAGSRALQKKPWDLLPSVVGCEGEVVNPLRPEGMVRVKGELWAATSEGDKIAPGEEVMITKVEALKLWVAKKSKK